MRRPLLLDLFCGAGGCAVGYHRAGFDVVGVDIEPQPRYPFECIKADALEVLQSGDLNFDAIHASPPCQKFSRAAQRAGTADRHPDLLTPTRSLLSKLSVPWVIENVPGAPVRTWFYLCGTMFGLQVRRHRYFETGNWTMPALTGMHCNHNGKFYSVFGHGAGNRNGKKRNDTGTVAEWRTAMGIDWMTRDELSQAIPPAYCEWIGRLMQDMVQERLGLPHKGRPVRRSLGAHRQGAPT